VGWKSHLVVQCLQNKSDILSARRWHQHQLLRYDLLLENTQKYQLNRLRPAHIYDMTTTWGQLSLSAFWGRYISSKLQLHVGHHNQWRRHLANAYELWCNLQVKLCDPSIPEHTEGEVLTNWCYTNPFLSFMIWLWYSYITAMRSYDFVVAPMTQLRYKLWESYYRKWIDRLIFHDSSQHDEYDTVVSRTMMCSATGQNSITCS